MALDDIMDDEELEDRLFEIEEKIKDLEDEIAQLKRKGGFSTKTLPRRRR